MQTFLPDKSFQASAKILDNKRLGKQRVEALQIAQSLLVKESNWKNHPAVLMWRGYEKELLVYTRAIMDEWISRGYKNDKCEIKWKGLWEQVKNKSTTQIPWLTSDFVECHRSNLIRKKPEYYSKFNWNVSDGLEYIWPVRIK